MHTDDSLHADSRPSSPFPVSAAEPQGTALVGQDLTLWQRVDALRELLHQGGHLLGEVATLIRNAEESLAAAAAEKRILEQHRRKSEEECLQLRRESRVASDEIQRQRSEVENLLRDVEQARSVSNDSAQRIATLQSELALARRQPLVQEETAQDFPTISHLQGRLQLAETRLEQTRATLASERERRNRAISLIKPISHESSSLQANPAT